MPRGTLPWRMKSVTEKRSFPMVEIKYWLIHVQVSRGVWWKSHEWVCKPGSVPGIAAQSRRRSFIFARRLLAASTAIYPNVQRGGQPRDGRCASAVSILFDLAPGGVYQAGRVTPTAGALLPHRFSLATHQASTWILNLTVRRSTLCCTFPNLAVGRRYRPPCPTEPGLSSSHQKMASDRPAHSWQSSE